MKYNGIELEPITTPQIFDPPKKMVVWDSSCGTPQIEPVCAITIRKPFPVITVESFYDYCAEIPQEEPKRATNLQLAEWLAKGNGLVLIGELICNHYDFPLQEENEPAECVQIHPFGAGASEWLEPTLENMGMEDK